MRVSPLLLQAGLLFAACSDLTLPPAPPPPGPGTLQGRIVYSVPGRSETRPAAGAEVALLGSSERTTADLETGRFLLTGLRQAEGQVLVRFDADGDGVVDRQRLLDLAALKAGPGRDVELGDVSLARNASASGRVLRSAAATGHAGTTVFVPGGPWVTASADDGSYLLENLPEGPVSVAFFSAGFGVDSRETQLLGGQEAQLGVVTLLPAPPGTGRLTGTVRWADGAGAVGARVRVAAAGVQEERTLGADGVFTFDPLRVDLYQVAVELEGASSLRLYNVLVAAGDNALGELTLVPGTSTPVVLDGGAPLPDLDGGTVDAGPATVSAAIDPQTVTVSPGATVTLTGGRSGGVQPLVYHWRFIDAGSGAPTFSSNDSQSAVTTSFTAPDASVRLTVALDVLDGLSRMSPQSATAVVKVGLPPTATVSAGSTVRSGDLVTVLGNGASADGRPLTSYAWRQVTGPFVPEFALATGPQVSFVAPMVAAATPLSVELVVATDVGIASAPVSATFIVAPPVPWSVTVDVTPDAGVFLADGGTNVVRLTANVLNPPPGAAFTYSWTPSQRGCTSADGGVDLLCPTAFVLSNADAGQTEFVAPATQGTTLLDFSVVVKNVTDATERTATTRVPVRDQRPPECTALLTQWALRVDCDEPISGTGPFVGLPAHQKVLTASGAAALFSDPPTTLVSYSLSGILDLGGNVTSVAGASTPTNPVSPIFVSADTSTQEPRPRWVQVPGGDGKVRRFIAGRHVDTGGSRAAWLMDATNACTQGPQCPLTTTRSMSIFGAGDPPVDDALAVVGGRLYVGVSPSPPTLMEYSAGTWREVSQGVPPNATTPPRYLGLSAAGGVLSMLTTMDGGLQRVALTDRDAGTFTTAEIISGDAEYNIFSIGQLVDLGTGGALAMATTAGTGVRSLVRSGGTWTSFAPPGLPLVDVARVRGALFTGAQPSPVVSTAVDGGDTEFFGANEGLTWPMTLNAGNNIPAYDVARFGDAVVLVAVNSGTVIVGLLDRSTQNLVQVGGVLYSGAPLRPTVTVMDGEVGLAWQEFDGSGWKMMGLLLR